jgi:hypothetical protein
MNKYDNKYIKSLIEEIHINIDNINDINLLKNKAQLHFVEHIENWIEK